MGESLHTHLSRRESQIMDVVYRLGEASVADVVEEMPDEPGYNTVRVTMSNLEKKGHLTHREEGQRYVYRPSIPADEAKRSEMGHLLKTFFSDSPSQAILTLLDMRGERLGEQDLEEIAEWIRAARDGGDEE